MKKALLLSVLIVAVTAGAALLTAGAASSEYKVIKDGVSVEARKGGDVNWLKIKVTDTKGHTKVNITLPIAVADLVAACEDDNDTHIGKKCHIDLKQVLHALKKSGPMTLIEVEEDDETVKIWLE